MADQVPHAEALAALVRALEPALRAWLDRHPEMRPALPAIADYLRSLAQTSGTSADRPLAPSTAPAVPLSPPAPAMVHGPTVIAPRTSSAASVPLVFGGQSVFVKVEGSTSDIGRARAAAQEALNPAPSASGLSEGIAPPDPALIEERCRLKEASCRVYAARQSSPGDTEVWARTKVEMDQLLSRGKALPRCFMWVFWREREQPAPEIVTLCAECYQNLAMATSLAAMVVAREDLKRHRAQAMQFMATAQSALRVALRDTWLTSPDADQDDAHSWLRTTAQRVQQLIPRHMRLDDGADPFAWESLRAEISALRATVDTAAAASSKSSQKLNKLKYDVKRIEREGENAPPEYWSSLVTALEELTPSDSRVREVLRPISGLVPPDAHAPAIEPFLAAARHPDDEDEGAESTTREYSASVAKVRAALEGGRLVITGGEPYAHQQRNLEDAFALGELEWISLREHASSEPLLSAIRRSGTRLVLVLIKLAGHAHVEDAQNQCRALGIPCVLLKAGVNPERVAADILAQASVSLGLDQSAA